MIFLQRNLKNRLSNRQYALVTVLVPLLLGGMSAWFCRGTPEGPGTFRDNANIPVFFFISVIFALFSGLNTSGEEILKDARILLRERFLHLSWGAYTGSKFLFLGSMAAIQMGLFLLFPYLVLKLPTNVFMLWGVLFSLAMVSCSLGLNISAAMKTASAVYILIPLILIPQILLCGAILPYGTFIPKDAGNRNVPLLDPDTGRRRSKPEEFRLLRNELARLAEQYGRPFPFSKVRLSPESYTRKDKQLIKTYLADLGKEIRAFRKKRRDEKEAIDEARAERLGGQGLLELKDSTCNDAVDALVLNTFCAKPLYRSGSHLVQAVSPISQPPASALGGAPFLSAAKKIGTQTLPTLYFNIGVLWLFFIAGDLCLLLRLLQRALG